jgi:hypothetical protein
MVGAKPLAEGPSSIAQRTASKRRALGAAWGERRSARSREVTGAGHRATPPRKAAPAVTMEAECGRMTFTVV